ncbi:hypothetical protein KI387_043527, partial [Taxus chinensis]
SQPFVRFYSCFHHSLVEPNLEPLLAETTPISPVLPFMADPEKETEVLRLPNPSLERSFSDLVLLEGHPEPPGRVLPRVSSKEWLFSGYGEPVVGFSFFSFHVFWFSFFIKVWNGE